MRNAGAGAAYASTTATTGQHAQSGIYIGVAECAACAIATTTAISAASSALWCVPAGKNRRWRDNQHDPGNRFLCAVSLIPFRNPCRYCGTYFTIEDQEERRTIERRWHGFGGAYFGLYQFFIHTDNCRDCHSQPVARQNFSQ